MKNIFLALFLLFLSCSVRNEKTDGLQKTENFITSANTAQTIETEAVQNNSCYVYENDTLKQIATINHIDKNTITFKLTSYNKRIEKSVTIEGRAKSTHSDFGGENDADEDGNAYFVAEYIHTGDCWLSFRIDVDTQTTMKVTLADCEENPSTPFTSVGLLRNR